MLVSRSVICRSKLLFWICSCCWFLRHFFFFTSKVISVASDIEREKSEKFCSEAVISAWGSFTCRKSTTRDPRLYFLSEGSHTQDFYALKNISSNPAGFEPEKNLKSRLLRWAGHVARLEVSRHAYRVLMGRPEGGRDADGRVILKWIWRMWVFMLGTGWIFLKIGPMVGLCTGGNALPDSLTPIFHHQSVLPEGRSFTASSGT